jgi:hypothetical protein
MNFKYVHVLVEQKSAPMMQQLELAHTFAHSHTNSLRNQ